MPNTPPKQGFLNFAKKIDQRYVDFLGLNYAP